RLMMARGVAGAGRPATPAAALVASPDIVSPPGLRGPVSSLASSECRHAPPTEATTAWSADIFVLHVLSCCATGARVRGRSLAGHQLIRASRGIAAFCLKSGRGFR